MNKHYKTVVIGGGPAGLAAAISAHKSGAKALLIEREARLGGILKQCIHDGFGVVRFGEKMSGPEYAERFAEEFYALGIDVMTLTFVTKITKEPNGFYVTVVSKNGIETIESDTIILATGCRERTAKQVMIHGTRPSGIFTAGTAQNFTNLLGQRPGKRCVILGSGDIGLIMARRLTLEGAEVLGVYEAKSTPSGLTRNIHQCLIDFNIPLHLSHTVTRVFGDDRLNAIEISEVDEHMKPIAGTEKTIECDTLILSVGLIPENELAESLSVELDAKTKGAVCDAQMMTCVDGVFSCGNALHVNDLVDYVSESGELAGKCAAEYSGEKTDTVPIDTDKKFLYAVPQQLNLNADNSQVIVYFRSRDVLDNCRVVLTVDGEKKFEKKFAFLRPPEMERIALDFDAMKLNKNSKILFSIEEVNAR